MTKARSKQSSEKKGDEPTAKRPSRRLEPEQRQTQRQATRTSTHIAQDHVDGDRREFLDHLTQWAWECVVGEGGEEE